MPEERVEGVAADQREVGWRGTLALFAFVISVEGFLVSHFISFGPYYLLRIGLPGAELPKWTGLLSALPFLVGFPLVPLWGVWADRYGRGVILARSALVEAVVALVAAFAQTPLVYAVAWSLSGFQLGNTGIMYAVLSERAPRHRTGFALGLISTASTLGFAIGPAIGGPIADRFDYRVLFLVDCLLSVASALALMVGFREAARLRVTDEGRVWTQAMRAAVAAVLSPDSRRVFAIYTLIMLARSNGSSFSPLMMRRVYGGAEIASVSGIVFGAAALAGAVAAPAAGGAGDRLGFGRVLQVLLVVAGMALGVVSLAPNILGLGVAYAATVALGAGCVSLCVALLATRTSEAQRSTTLNLALVPLYVGSSIGPPFGAVVAQAIGVPWVFVTSGLVLVGGSLLALRLR